MLVIPKAFYVIDFWATRLLLIVSNKSIFWLQEYLMISALAISSENMCPTSVKYPKLLLIQCQFIAIMYNCKRRNVLYSEASYKRTFACMTGHSCGIDYYFPYGWMKCDKSADYILAVSSQYFPIVVSDNITRITTRNLASIADNLEKETRNQRDYVLHVL